MFEGKVYCISGAASVSRPSAYPSPCTLARWLIVLLQGIGRATALRLASKKVSGLALSDLDIRGLESTAEECKLVSMMVEVMRT